MVGTADCSLGSIQVPSWLSAGVVVGRRSQNLPKEVWRELLEQARYVKQGRKENRKPGTVR